MRIIKYIITIPIALILTVVGGEAQFHWNVIHTDSDGRYYYSFESISCFRNVCTAAGSLVDTLSHSASRVFYRSTDRGNHWAIQDPGLPTQTDLHLYLNSNYFAFVQQLDSLHAVALQNGGAGIAMQTSDGGVTWQQANPQFAGSLASIDFSDPSNGMMFGASNLVDTAFGHHTIEYGAGPAQTFITSNDGATWDSGRAAFPSIYSKVAEVQCHTFGAGHFCLFTPGHGKLFTTKNNWKTYDSTSAFIDSSNDPLNYYQLFHCSFLGTDTIFSYGRFRFGGPTDYKGVIFRSTDAGKSWDVPSYVSQLSRVDYLSNLYKDTLLAGGTGSANIVMSTDRGGTWKVDTLAVDTGYNIVTTRGISITDQGQPLIICAQQQDINTASPSIIIRGNLGTERVEWASLLGYHDRIFPNPATTTLNIASIEASTPFRIIDILGRVIMTGMVGDHTTLTLDVARLPRGAYYLFVDNTEGIPIIAGKLMLVGY
jgi:photosystem II stability/assembly factor-like uncharacterized protein